MNRRELAAVLVSVLAVAGCAHDTEGHAVRTGNTRFDATSVSAAHGPVITRNSDGTWGASRLERVGDRIQPRFGPAFGYWAYVEVTQLPNGLRYTPSSYAMKIWTFVTEDGKPIPEDLEIPLYLAANNGMGGTWVNIWEPARDDTGPRPVADCGVVLFELQGRQVAGWVARQGATCPEPRYPGREVLARLIYSRNEVWVSPERPLP